MKIKDFSSKELENIISEIDYDINLLYENSSVYTRNQILDHLKGKVYMLEVAIKSINKSGKQPLPFKIEDHSMAEKTLVSIDSVLSENQKTFTLQELSKFDGKNGNPAYVAVNGNVYDVTNNAAWAAATHFGLIAGKDLTKEFASCHAGQTILSKLKLVGKLV